MNIEDKNILESTKRSQANPHVFEVIKNLKRLIIIQENLIKEVKEQDLFDTNKYKIYEKLLNTNFNIITSKLKLHELSIHFNKETMISYEILLLEHFSIEQIEKVLKYNIDEFYININKKELKPITLIYRTIRQDIENEELMNIYRDGYYEIVKSKGVNERGSEIYQYMSSWNSFKGTLKFMVTNGYFPSTIKVISNKSSLTQLKKKYIFCNRNSIEVGL